MEGIKKCCVFFLLVVIRGSEVCCIKCVDEKHVYQKIQDCRLTVGDKCAITTLSTNDGYPPYPFELGCVPTTTCGTTSNNTDWRGVTTLKNVRCCDGEMCNDGNFYRSFASDVSGPRLTCHIGGSYIGWHLESTPLLPPTLTTPQGSIICFEDNSKCAFDISELDYVCATTTQCTNGHIRCCNGDLCNNEMFANGSKENEFVPSPINFKCHTGVGDSSTKPQTQMYCSTLNENNRLDEYKCGVTTVDLNGAMVYGYSCLPAELCGMNQTIGAFELKHACCEGDMCNASSARGLCLQYVMVLLPILAFVAECFK